MDSPAGNQAYIYKNVNDNFSRDNVSAVLSHQGENKRFFSYHSSPGTEIAVISVF